MWNMQSAGVEIVDSRVRIDKGTDENQSREKSLPEPLEFELAPASVPSSFSTHPASGSHSNAAC